MTITKDRDVVGDLEKVLGNEVLGSKESVLLDSSKNRVYVDGQQVYLTRNEFDLLKYLMINSGKVCTYEKISEGVWGYKNEEDNNEAIRTHMSRLKQRIGKDHIVTVPGFGYKCTISNSNGFTTKRDPIQIGDFVFDIDGHELYRTGEEEKSLIVPKKEYSLLSTLVENPNRVFSYTDLIQLLNPGEEVESDIHLLRTHVSRLRTLLEDNSVNPVYIKNFAKRGYAFITQVTSPQKQPVKES